MSTETAAPAARPLLRSVRVVRFALAVTTAVALASSARWPLS